MIPGCPASICISELDPHIAVWRLIFFFKAFHELDLHSNCNISNVKYLYLISIYHFLYLARPDMKIYNAGYRISGQRQLSKTFIISLKKSINIHYNGGYLPAVGEHFQTKTRIHPLANVNINLSIYEDTSTCISQNAVWFLLATGKLSHFKASFLTVSVCPEIGPPVPISEYLLKHYKSCLSKNDYSRIFKYTDPGHSFVLK